MYKSKTLVNHYQYNRGIRFHHVLSLINYKKSHISEIVRIVNPTGRRSFLTQKDWTTSFVAPLV